MGKIGIIYVATGDKYCAMARKSAMSAKRVMPNVPIKLWTDIETHATASDPFDYIKKIERPYYHYRDKIAGMFNEEFDKFLFVDVDTFFLRSVEPVFDLLDRFDLVAAHEPFRPGAEFGSPQAFAELNTGVLFLKNTARMTGFLRQWEKCHAALSSGDEKLGDQKSFRRALWDGDLRFFILPPEYNFRTCYPAFAGSGSPVYIVHDHSLQDDFTGVDALLNKNTGFRVFLGSVSQLNEASFGFISKKSQRMLKIISPIVKAIRKF